MSSDERHIEKSRCPDCFPSKGKGSMRMKDIRLEPRDLAERKTDRRDDAYSEIYGHTKRWDCLHTIGPTTLLSQLLRGKFRDCKNADGVASLRELLRRAFDGIGNPIHFRREGVSKECDSHKKGFCLV